METRLMKELKLLSTNSPEGISCYPKYDNNFRLLLVSIHGPKNSAYEGGIFELEVSIPEKYPIEPPNIRFLTRIYHPNIDENGLICLDLLKMPPLGKWRPLLQLQNLFVAIQNLMTHPNADDPLVPEIAFEYKFFNDEFKKKAKKCARNSQKNS